MGGEGGGFRGVLRRSGCVVLGQLVRNQQTGINLCRGAIRPALRAIIKCYNPPPPPSTCVYIFPGYIVRNVCSAFICMPEKFS